jgi:tetratricopeptide (TPR) repeat protein
MRSTRRLVIILAALTLALTPDASALGQGAPKRTPSKQSSAYAQAKKLFEQGTAAYGEGDYAAAIDAWTRSYELSEEPLIFESIAHAYERLGDLRRSRENLARWRASAPREEHATLDAHLRNLDARIAREEEDAARATRVHEEAMRGARAEQARKSRESSERVAWSTLAILGAGGALVGVGVALDLVANAERQDARAACAPGADGRLVCLASAREGIGRSNTLATAGDALWIGGAAAIVAGAALAIGRPRWLASTEAASVSPQLARGGFGLVVHGRF